MSDDPSHENRPQTRSDYVRRVTRVIAYIHDNLDGDLSAGRLADVANFSTYHWHRVFHAMTGSTVAEMVRRLRLQRAAMDLHDGNRDMLQIASRAGYSTVEAFSRAFRSAYGQPPVTFRDSRLSIYAINPANHQEERTMHPVEIREIEPIALATVEHRGAYTDIGRAFESLMVKVGAAGLMGAGSRIVGIYYDDPSEVAEADLRSAAGVSIDPDRMAANLDLNQINIEGGRHAVMRHVGPYPELPRAYEWLFGSWLPASGEEAAHRPCFEEYLNDPSGTPPTELITEIHLPLK